MRLAPIWFLAAIFITQTAYGKSGDVYKCETNDFAFAHDHEFSTSDDVRIFSSAKQDKFILIEQDGYMLMVRVMQNGITYSTHLTIIADTDMKYIAGAPDDFGMSTLVMSRISDTKRATTISLQTSSIVDTWQLSCSKSG